MRLLAQPETFEFNFFFFNFKNMMKFYLSLRFRHTLKSFMDFGEHLFNINSNGLLENTSVKVAMNRYNCLKNCAKTTYYYLCAVLTTFLLGGALFISYPLWLMLSQGKRTWILPILLPMTDLDANAAQFYINIGYQIVCTGLATSTTIAFDLYFTTCICFHTTCVKLLNETIDEFSSMWTDSDSSELAKKLCLRNILKQLQDMDTYALIYTILLKRKMFYCIKLIIICRYILKVNNAFSSVLLVQPMSASISITISLFCIVINNWYAGYGYIILTFSQMISYCAVGQTVQNNVS